MENLGDFIKIIGERYSCRWKVRLSEYALEKNVYIQAHKGKAKVVFNFKILWLEEIKRFNWYKELLADIYRFFDLYFIQKEEFSVFSCDDKRIKRI